MLTDNCGDMCLDYQENYFAWENLGIGRSMVFLALQAVVFWSLIILVETEIIIKLFYRLRPKLYVQRQP